MPKKRKTDAAADYESHERLKALVIIALFSVDEFLDRFVLKGGNAIDIVYKAGTRASADVDVSMSGDFEAGSLDSVRTKLESSLRITFRPLGYEVFDVNLAPRPARRRRSQPATWGGYRLEFKLIERERFQKLGAERAAVQAISLGTKGKIQIDISKYEFTGAKQSHDLQGTTIYVYSPEMIVGEKLRAICQQMPEYCDLMSTSQTPRARDFFDIQALVTRYQIDMTVSQNIALLQEIFAAKQVPLNLLGRIKDYRSFHEIDFLSVRDTLKPGLVPDEFGDYFAFVVELCGA